MACAHNVNTHTTMFWFLKKKKDTRSTFASSETILRPHKKQKQNDSARWHFGFLFMGETDSSAPGNKRLCSCRACIREDPHLGHMEALRVFRKWQWDLLGLVRLKYNTVSLLVRHLLDLTGNSIFTIQNGYCTALTRSKGKQSTGIKENRLAEALSWWAWSMNGGTSQITLWYI